MRRACGLVTLVIGLLYSTGLRAADVLYTARVVTPQTLVRSGPSDDPKLYATNRLVQGATVEVVREMPGGWLAINPPPDSLSWVNMRFLKQTGKHTWLVECDPDSPIDVRYGSRVENVKPTVESARLRRGTQVVSTYMPETGDDGKWLAIDPPPGEVRYLHASDVVSVSNPAAARPSATPTSQNPLVTPPAMPPAASSPPATSPTGAPLLWTQAQQAESEHRYIDAINLYEQLCREMNGTDPMMSRKCCQRITYLNQLVAASNYGTPQRLTPTPAGSTPAPASQQVQAAAYQRPAQASGYQPQPAPASAPSNPAQVMKYSGYLRQAGSTIEGQQAFRLEDSAGNVIAYITAQPGSNVNLAAHTGTMVQVTGPTVYRASAFRHNHMSATEVAPLQ